MSSQPLFSFLFIKYDEIWEMDHFKNEIWSVEVGQLEKFDFWFLVVGVLESFLYLHAEFEAWKHLSCLK